MRLLMRSGLYGVMAFGLMDGVALAQTATDADKASDKKTEVKAPDAKAPSTQTPASKDSAAQAKAATDANATGDNTTVTITGQKPVNRIDRQVYDVSKDPDSKTGTAADVLNKVPGVSVDPTGNVTVRGKDPQILVNGRPASYLSGDNRAAALQAMPSGSISSVEVINNPGAQYSSGSGTILNLITNTALPPGGFGSLSAQLQSTGSKTGSFFGQYHTGKISLTSVLSLSNNKSDSLSGSAQRSLDVNGQVLRSSGSNRRSKSDSNTAFSTLNFEYDFNPKDSLVTQLTYIRNSALSDTMANNVSYNNLGVATDIYTSSSQNRNGYESQMGELTWNHTGAQVGETLKVDWRVSRTLNKGNTPSLSLYSLSTVSSNLAGRRTLFANTNKSNNSTFSVDYNLPIGNDQLTTGIQITNDNNDTLGQSFGPAAASATTLPPSAFGNNRFDYSQTINAAYITYQKPFGNHWSVLAGVRAEMFELNADAPLVSLTNHVKYTTYNPSLFATYVFSEKAKLRLSYSHRLARPNAYDYNPATVQSSETSVSVGQANLKPQETDSYEAGYEYTVGKTNYALRGYYTRDTGMIIYVSNFIADPLNLGNLVVRTSRQNAGTREATGVEFNFSGKLTPKLSLNFNANLSATSFDSPNFNGTKSVTGLNSTNRLTYTPNAKDTFVLSYNIQPKLLSPQGQGYRTGYSTVNLQYSRKLSQKLTLIVAANDVLRSTKTENFTVTPTSNSFYVRSSQAPTFYISLSRRFGGTPVIPKGGLVIGSPAPSGAGAASPGGGGGGGGGIIIR
jgi:outer membrane receptor protein involved in Fe transport